MATSCSTYILYHSQDHSDESTPDNLPSKQFTMKLFRSMTVTLRNKSIDRSHIPNEVQERVYRRNRQMSQVDVATRAGWLVAWCSVAWYDTDGAPPDAGWASIDWVGALVAASVSRVQEERVAESPGAITRGHRDRRLKGRPASGRDLDSPKRWS